jgi:hypothetical protein
MTPNKAEDYFIYCKGLFNTSTQLSLLREINKLLVDNSPLYSNRTGQGGSKRSSIYLQLFNLHLSNGTMESLNKFEILETVPSLFSECCIKCIEHAASKNSKIRLSLYKPGLCEFIMYDADGFVEEHCDCINGWVAVISLGVYWSKVAVVRNFVYLLTGMTANFWYYDSTKSKICIEVSSGDAVVFNGSAVINLRHGVDSIVRDSFPQELDEVPPLLQNKRIILQIHQELKL